MDDDAKALTPKKDRRNRLQFRFWLNSFDPDDQRLMWFIQDMIDKREWQKTIRAALRIYWGLREGDPTWLLRHFEDVEDMIYRHRWTHHDE